MKKVVFLTSLAMAFLALPLLTALPVAAGDKEKEVKDLQVDVLKPFEEADPGKVGISDVKVEQLKKAEHVLIEEVEPPRIKDEQDVEDFDEADFKKIEVKPFDKADAFSRQTLPFATEQELAGALEFQDLDDTLEGRFDADKAAENLVQVDPKLTHSGISANVDRAERFGPTANSAGQTPSAAETAANSASAAREVVRFGNRIGENERTSTADLSGLVSGTQNAAGGGNLASQDAANRATPAEGADREVEDENVLAFNRMVGSSAFNAAVHGVSGAASPMSVNSGSVSLDRQNNLNVRVDGLRHADGTPAAAGQSFGAGIACMDSGFFPAGGEQGENFTLDESGNGTFTGTLDFAGRGCVAPAAMITSEDGSFVAVSANPAMDEAMALNETGTTLNDTAEF